MIIDFPKNFRKLLLVGWLVAVVITNYSPNAKVDKVCIHQDMVRRPKLLVVPKEQGSVGLFDLARLFILLFLRQFHCFGLVHIFSDAGIVRRHHPFGDGKLSGLFGFPHGCRWLNTNNKNSFPGVCVCVFVVSSWISSIE